MISVERALEVVLQATAVLEAEDIRLEEALGRVLREDVLADRDFPPFDRAAMDGFAVRAEDVARPGAVLDVIGEIRAGQWPETELRAGQALAIMTGAPLPLGADAVQQVEKTARVARSQVRIDAPVARGQNVARMGSEVRRGELVLAAGRVIDPATIAVLASVGKAAVRVGLRPRVGVVSTGDELVEVSALPEGACIRNSNGPAVMALVETAGARGRSLGIVRDELRALEAAVRQGLGDDVLVVSGGVSAGAYDLVEDVLRRFGVETLFDRVAIKPGAPLVFGRHGAGLVFGLPGNPVSAQVTFELFVRPALLKMQGVLSSPPPGVEVELMSAAKNRSGRKAHLPALVRFEQGRFVAEMLPSMGSADLVAHARANALVVLESARTEARAGERAPALLLASFLGR